MASGNLFAGDQRVHWTLGVRCRARDLYSSSPAEAFAGAAERYQRHKTKVQYPYLVPVAELMTS